MDLFDLCIEKLLVFLQGHAGGVVQILKILLTLLNLKINILGVLLHRDKRVPSLVKNSHFLVQVLAVEALLALIEAFLQFLTL